jgi:ubiquinone/menaquinone biosynthesis C-methylase UbiE
MADQTTAFTGSVPENYDRYLGPMLFAPYARDLVQRIPQRDDICVLELACGTGIVTARLRAYLPESARLCATDLNKGMLNFAKTKHSAPGIEWQLADMMALPFADESFDYVLCQFGMMFLPDKVSAMREARRVLKEDGRFLFNVWDSLEANDLSRVAHETIVSFFPSDPPRFYETPFGSYDAEAMRGFLDTAGFRNVEMTPVEFECVSPTAHDAATGLVQGTPIVVAVKDRDRSAIPKLTDAVAHALAREFGEQPCRARMRALVWEATR